MSFISSILAKIIERRLRYASQSIDTVYVHSATSADALAAGLPVGQRRIMLRLDQSQHIKDHCAAFVQIHGELLHVRLYLRRFRIPSVYANNLWPRCELCRLRKNGRK